MESSQGIVTSQDTSNSAPVINSSPVESNYSAPAVTQAEERSFRQSEVNEIVKKAKYGAVEDYKRISQQQPDYAQQKYGSAAPQVQQPYTTPQNSGQSSDEQLRRIASEEIQRSRDEWLSEARNRAETEAAQRVVQNFWNKIGTGKEKYQDFEQITGDIEYARFPNVVQLLADHVDNAGDIMYELGKDRVKMAAIEQLASMSPKDAITHMQKLSKSIKDNEAAGKVRMPNEPLSQLRPSNTGTDNGALSVKDLRRKYMV